MKNKEVGVVIIGRNEGERLILCLESVLNAGVPCVYVDSQSKDNSVAEAESRKVTTVVLDDSSPINASRARNTGFDLLVANNSDLEFVHFIDADCELDENWLGHAVSKLKSSKEVAIICGRLHEKYKFKNIYTRLCDIDWYIRPGNIRACGGIFTVKRTVFSKMNGFDETLIAGADPELCYRVCGANYKIFCLPFDMGTHDCNMENFSEYWKRSVKTGYAYISRMSLGESYKPVLSACIWGAIIPLVVFFLSLFNVQFLWLLLIYLVQCVRVFLKFKNQPFPVYSKCVYSVFCMIGKFSETIGVLRFKYNSIMSVDQGIIEYKKR
ncbi:glycosyltransferase family A protein [uncultured Cycloclasticus sp.]|uniref:glycosyltransferase n=1 Tax=uncultured Cycloclasticus sp. TaxID=172194 RepID=UPI002589D75B|nr:glycosyltransferase family A protein [uncultured Cycloclasticus sp.]